jgi:two-component system, response regulator YesN
MAVNDSSIGGVKGLYRILLVDDEQIERDGIKRLLDKYQFQFTVMEAENGEEALDILAKEPVDILFTDIKMPFMDGLELSRRARELYAGLKIMIFSAYGEFEYAQKAIQYNIFAYLLKPVEVEEFVRVFTDVSRQCRQERERQEQEDMLQLGYRKGMEYEKERMLLDLLSGSPEAVEGAGKMLLAGTAPGRRLVQMVLIDFGHRFFERHGHNFADVIRGWMESDFEYVNLNESQSLLFLLREPGPEDVESAVRLKDGISDSYGEKVTLVIGRPLAELEQLKDEYRRMEELLENQFFYKDSVIFYTDAARLKRHHEAKDLSALMEPIYWHLGVKDYFGFRKGVDLFFQVLAEASDHSAIYIKYTCIELTRKLLEATGKEGQFDFRSYVEGIFNCRSLADMKLQVDQAMTALNIGREEGSPEYTKKVIKDILQLIEEHYMTDISLKWIADQVFLTQAYVSHLFSKEMGQTLVKYLTMVRMQKAAEELRRSNHTIAHISEQVGYLNDSYFGKIFKNHYGVSPAKYREMNG